MGRLGHFFAGLLTVVVIDAVVLGLMVGVGGLSLDAAAAPQEKAAKAAFAKAVKAFPDEARTALPGGVTLLSRPSAVGDYFCQARALVFSPKTKHADERIETSDVLVLRRLPGETAQSAAQAQSACAKWSDFSHPILGERATVERAVGQLAAAQTLARAGSLRVAPDCLDLRKGARRACDTPALLAALDLHGLYGVKGLADEPPLATTPGATDDITLQGGKGPCGAQDTIQVRIVSRWAGEGRPMAIAAIRVRITSVC